MNYLFALFSFLFLTFGKPSDVNYSEIEAAFMKNNTEAVVKMGNDKLLISLFGKENIYSNQQASVFLKDFLTKHPLTQFKFIFKGKESQEGSFAIAKYETKSENFRFTFNFKNAESNYKITRINIEKD